MPRPSGAAAGLPPLLARRLEWLIDKKTPAEVGVLADYMANVCATSFQEKTKVLSLFDVKQRTSFVIELLERQITSIKSNFKITNFTKSSVPTIIIQNDEDEGQTSTKSRAPARRGGFGIPIPNMKAKPGQGNEKDDDDEPNELEELQKRLESAKLSPEDAKIAEREIKRLKKMSPAQAD